jgi:zinc-binding in reverse transcriptase
VLANLFDVNGVEVIKMLQGVSKQNSLLSDRLIWTDAPNGRYSVKTGYNSLMEAAHRDEGTEVQPYWHTIWDLDVIPRVKLFFWRAGHNALPVLAVIHNRIQGILPLCPICGVEDESVRHMLFDCDFARAAWFICPLQIRTPDLPMDFKQAVLELMSGMCATDQKTAGYISWEIWKARNKFHFEHTLPDPNQIVNRALALSLTRKAQPQTRQQTAPDRTTTLLTLTQGVEHAETAMQRGKNLPVAIVDASIDQSGRAGAGVTFYIVSGHLQLVHLTPIDASTPFQAEAEALKLAIPDWSSPYFQKPSKIFTDCKNLVDFLENGENEVIPC